MFTYPRSNKNTVLNAIEVMSWMTHDDNDTIHSSYNRAHGWSDDQHLYYSVVISGGWGGVATQGTYYYFLITYNTLTLFIKIYKDIRITLYSFLIILLILLLI